MSKAKKTAAPKLNPPAPALPAGTIVMTVDQMKARVYDLTTVIVQAQREIEAHNQRINQITAGQIQPVAPQNPSANVGAKAPATPKAPTTPKK